MYEFFDISKKNGTGMGVVALRSSVCVYLTISRRRHGDYKPISGNEC